MIQDAIETRHLLEFKYFAPSGESDRTIEPYYIVFKWTSWYVYGWCLKRNDYRLFKLNRMDKVLVSDKGFECRNVPLPDMSAELMYPRDIKVKALFDPDTKWRLVEEFGTDCCGETKDGKILFSADYSDMDNLVSWMLTFGDKVEVLEPQEVRERLKEIADNMSKKYGRKDNE